jgi:hypothetical protein
VRSRTFAPIVGSLALVAGLAAALIFSGCGGGGSDQATAEARPKSVPPHFYQARYDVIIYNGWPQYESDKRVGNYLESAWHDGGNEAVDILIDSRASDGTGSPMASAELARLQAERLPGYQARTFKKTMIGTQPAVRLGFVAAGKGYFDYFFERCGTSFIARGWMPPSEFASYTGSVHAMASSIKVVCDA